MDCFNLVIEKLMIPTEGTVESVSISSDVTFQSRNRETYDSNCAALPTIACSQF